MPNNKSKTVEKTSCFSNSTFRIEEDKKNDIC